MRRKKDLFSSVTEISHPEGSVQQAKEGTIQEVD